MISFAARRRAHLELGRRGEELAAQRLRQQGYLILARNWRTGAGELDIVAAREEKLLFAEVKTLHKKAGYSPIGNLSSRQRLRNINAAKIYLALMGKPQIEAHFDLFCIEYTPGGKLVSFSRTADYLPPVYPQPKAEKIPEVPLPEKEQLPEESVPFPAGGGFFDLFHLFATMGNTAFWKKLWRSLNLLPCPVCRKGDGSGRGVICADCKKRLELFPAENRCPGCGGELDGVLSLCRQCLERKNIPLWQGIVSLFSHKGTGRQIILDLKYGGRTEYCRFLGEMGAQAVSDAHFQVDVVTFVPMHWKRRMIRSYDQAELFAQMTARQLALPCQKLLVRKKAARRQETLNRSGRLKNLKNAFVCASPEKISGKKILLVDDVFTTGATMTAAVRALLKAKPAAVYLLTISRTPRYFEQKRRIK